MKTDREMTTEAEVTQDCPILFQMRHRPCNETCMCWGFECHEGWHRTIASTCRELEMLNAQYYPKYRARIQADQIKEKFGTLHFYYSVVVDPNKFITWLGHKFESAYDFLNNCKRFVYEYKKVVDIEPYDYDEKKELTEEEYRRELESKIKCSNVELKEENGKYIEICHLRNYGKSHLEPTKHKIAHALKNFCRKASNWLLYSFPKKDNAMVRNCIELLDRKAGRIIRAAEKECESHCEICGHQIGTDWSPACQTAGWISYICDDCAEKSDRDYFKNGELWHGDKIVKTKEELAAVKKKNEESRKQAIEAVRYLQMDFDK